MHLGHADEPLAEVVGADAFGVVRNGDAVEALFHPVEEPLFQRIGFRTVQIAHFLEIEAEHLLPRAEDAHLRNGGAVRRLHQARSINAGVRQQPVQDAAVVVVPRHAGHEDLAAQARQVRCHIGGAAQYRLDLLHMVHGNRCFRGNTLHFAVKVAVHHHVPHDGDAQVLDFFRYKGRTIQVIHS